MTALQEAEDLLARMSPPEKAQLFQWVARDVSGIFPGIESDPNVLGGESRIVRTRIPVWLLARTRQSGLTEAAILAAYPTLREEDLSDAWAYIRANRDEIERHIRDNEEN